MEETIGYEALFSAEEWNSMTFGEWTDDPDGSPSGVTTNGDGSAALSQAVAPEGTKSSTVGPRTSAATPADRNAKPKDKAPIKSSELMNLYEGPEHKVSCTHRVWGDEPGMYLLECDICEIIGSATTLEEAQAIARLHESFVAELVGQWTVTS